MSRTTPMNRKPTSVALVLPAAGVAMLVQNARTQAPATASRPAPIAVPPTNAMTNPYRMLPMWPQLGDIKSGGAIGIVPDGSGGVWLQHRSDPGIAHIDSAGKVVQRIVGSPESPEGGGNVIRNPGWKNGIRVGSAKDGSIKYFIEGTRPEGVGADERGNIFGGLTGGCDASPSGGCLQKFVKK